jgi:hypothetical protein
MGQDSQYLHELKSATSAMYVWSINVILDDDLHEFLQHFFYRKSTLNYILELRSKRRSQWPHGLSHELSPLARMLRSWVWIPLKTWLSVCAFILCLCCPVWRRADHSSKLSYRLCKKDSETEEENRAQQRAVQPLMNEWMNEWMNECMNSSLIFTGLQFVVSEDRSWFSSFSSSECWHIRFHGQRPRFAKFYLLLIHDRLIISFDIV